MARNYNLKTNPLRKAEELSNEEYSPFSIDNATILFQQVAHLLSPQHREYLMSILEGEGEVDPLMDLEITLRLVSMYSMQAVSWSLGEAKLTKDIGSILGEVRQGAVAIENIKNKRDELKKEEALAEENATFDPTRKFSRLDFLNDK